MLIYIIRSLRSISRHLMPDTLLRIFCIVAPCGYWSRQRLHADNGRCCKVARNCPLTAASLCRGDFELGRLMTGSVRILAPSTDRLTLAELG